MFFCEQYCDAKLQYCCASCSKEFTIIIVNILSNRLTGKIVFRINLKVKYTYIAGLWNKFTFNFVINIKNWNKV